MNRLEWLLMAFLLTACPPAVPPGPDAAAPGPDASVPEDAVTIDAGPPAPLALTVTARATVPNADAGTALTPEVETAEVAPESVFEVELPHLADVRVRLFDDAERAVPSSDRLELGQPTRYRLAPTEPLVPGSRYTLAIDGLKGDLPTDPAGRAYNAVRLPLRTSGEKPEPPAAKAAKSKKKPGKKR
jgi:hypothetical protein